MQTKKLLLYLLYNVCFFIAYTCVDAKSAIVLHTPVISAVENIDVVITVSGSLTQDVIVRGTIFFRRIGEQEYLSQPMSGSGKVFEGKIPSRYVTGTALEYYIVLSIVDGTTITLPENNASSLPYVIVIVPAEKGWFEILYPETDSVIEDKRPQISAAFNTDTVNSKKDIQVRLDGRDVTDECEITQDFFSYAPSDDLSAGKHIVTIMNLSKPGMAGSWQFTISGKTALWQNLSGSASATCQVADSDSKSLFLPYNKGSNFGLIAQLGGQIFGKQFDGWINKNTLYGSRTTDFGFGFYGDKVTINAGDIFPSMSELVLDTLPARGADVTIKPFERLNIQILGAESRLFTGDDEFTANLVNSKFGGFRLAVSPIKKWEINASYVYAVNHTGSGPDIPFSMDKENNVMSFGTQINLPAQFALRAEWARSDHQTDYGEFGSESNLGQAVSASVSKQIGTLSLETFYIGVDDNFISEVSPFLEIGRKGLGFSVRYPHRLLSLQGEYTRYYRKDSVDTEMRANANLSLPKFPSFFLGYYQQRVPYAKYDVRGASLGSLYKFWKLDFSASGSWSNSNIWIDNTERSSFFSSVRVGYKLTSSTNTGAEYIHFRSYKSGNMSSLQRQASVEIQRYIKKSHLIGLALKSIRFTDKEKAENSYSENVMIFKYQYSF